MAIPDKLIFYQDNDQVVKITELHNGLDESEFFTSAIVTATLRDSAGNDVTGLIDLPLTYVPDPGDDPNWVEGTYQGLVEQTFAPPLGGGYILQITATQGSTVGNWFIKSSVKVRRT